jgi:hypothetical protein
VESTGIIVGGGLETYDYNKWSSEIISQIKKIDHACDFNQQNIIDQWSKNQNLLELYAIPVTLTVSSGFYIRQFVRDFSNEIYCPLLTYDINRLDFVEKKFGKTPKNVFNSIMPSRNFGEAYDNYIL